MEQLVRVRKCETDGTAQVVHIRRSACSGDCHRCSGCGAAEETLVFTARNPIGARPGQVVTVAAETGPVLAAAAVMYLLPLVLFFVGYLLTWKALWGCVGFACGIALAVVYDRLVVRKQKTVYTITGFGRMPGSGEKEENDLD